MRWPACDPRGRLTLYAVWPVYPADPAVSHTSRFAESCSAIRVNLPAQPSAPVGNSTSAHGGSQSNRDLCPQCAARSDSTAFSFSEPGTAGVARLTRLNCRCRWGEAQAGRTGGTCGAGGTWCRSLGAKPLRAGLGGACGRSRWALSLGEKPLRARPWGARSSGRGNLSVGPFGMICTLFFLLPALASSRSGERVKARRAAIAAS